MTTNTLSHDQLAAGFRARIMDSQGYIRLVHAEQDDLGTDAKDYSHIYADPSFDGRYGKNAQFTGRCEKVSTQLYELFRSEIRELQRTPRTALTPFQWDWFECAWAVLVDIEAMNAQGWKLPSACNHSAGQLFVLGKRYLDFDFLSPTVHKTLLLLINSAELGVGTRRAGRAS